MNASCVYPLFVFMPLWKIAWRSIQHRALASGLTAFSMGLGVALVVAVIVIHGVLDQTFKRSAQGYDIVVGPPKGSPLEIVLGAVFYSNYLSDTIPYRYFQEIETGSFSTEVETAIPIAIADRVKDMQVIATTPKFFTELKYLDRYAYTFRSGKNMGAGGDFEAVLGYTAAQKTGLKAGDRFKASMSEHVPSENVPEPDIFTVVGILNPTGTPNDQAMFINLEGFFIMNNHSRGGALESVLNKRRGDQRISAILVLTKDKDVAPVVWDDPTTGMMQVQIDPELTKQDFNPLTMSLGDRLVANLDVQVAKPTYEISRLFEMIVGQIQTVLMIFAVMVVIVAAIGMMVSIYNSMNERRQEIAIMRALGASRGTVMLIILLESILLSLGGGVIGMVIGHGLIAAVGPIIADAVMVVVNPWSFQLAELILIPGLILLASLVGYLPAVVAYRTDVAQSLNP
jgi:putative ABC transport system permease protein